MPTLLGKRKPIIRKTKDRKYNTSGLVNLRDRSPEEAKAIRQKGAAKVNEIKARRRALKEQLEDILALSMKRGKTKTDIASLEDFKDANVAVDVRMLVAVVMKALRGDIAAVREVRDILGEKRMDVALADVTNGGATGFAPIVLGMLPVAEEKKEGNDGNASDGASTTAK